MADDDDVGGAAVPAEPDPKPAGWWRWAPFEPGNQAALRHGAWSPRLVDPVAAEIVERMRADATEPGSPVAYLADPTYAASVAAWARVEARIQLLTEYLSGAGGDLDAEGAVRPAADLLTRLEGQAEKARARLGLDPLSRARLGRDVTASQMDLARLLAGLGAPDPSTGGGAAVPGSPAVPPVAALDGGDPMEVTDDDVVED